MTYDSSRSEQGAVGSSVVRGDRAGHADHADHSDHGFPPEDEGGSLDILGFLQRHQRRFVSATAIVGLLAVVLVGELAPPPPFALYEIVEFHWA